MSENKNPLEGRIAKMAIQAQIGAPEQSSLIEEHMKEYFTRWPSYKSKFTDLEWYHIFLDFLDNVPVRSPQLNAGEVGGNLLEKLKEARAAYIHCESSKSLKIIDDIIIQVEAGAEVGGKVLPKFEEWLGKERKYFETIKLTDYGVGEYRMLLKVIAEYNTCSQDPAAQPITCHPDIPADEMRKIYNLVQTWNDDIKPWMLKGVVQGYLLATGKMPRYRYMTDEELDEFIKQHEYQNPGHKVPAGQAAEVPAPGHPTIGESLEKVLNAQHTSPEAVPVQQGDGLEKFRAWPLFAYAPGNYYCTCCHCKNEFRGDKRAVECLECAVKMAQREFENFDSRIQDLQQERDQYKERWERSEANISALTEQLGVVQGERGELSAALHKLKDNGLDYEEVDVLLKKYPKQ